MPDRSDELLELAKKDFGKLTSAEKKFFQAVARGEFADYRVHGEKKTDPELAAGWGKERTLSAEKIMWVCTDEQAKSQVTHKGILIRGAKIVDPLELLFAQLDFPLSFFQCRIMENIDLRHSMVKGLFFEGSHIKKLAADGVRIDGSVYLRNGFRADGEVRLLGATIGGDLDCSRGRLHNPNGKTLFASRLNVRGSLHLREGFESIGEVCLLGSKIGNNLECGKGRFLNPKGKALSADRLNVEGSVFLNKDFEAQGVVSLSGATIGNNLECGTGRFVNPKRNALNADNLNVGGSVFLNENFEAQGAVHLPGATIGSNLECSSGHFLNPDGIALNTENAIVNGCVYFDYYFEASGVVRFFGASVSSTFVWMELENPTHTLLDLRHAKIGVLIDERASWPPPGNIYLDGLTYDRIHQLKANDIKGRLEWIRRSEQDNYTPQPYEQLAKVFSECGFDRAAKEIQIAKNRSYVKRAPVSKRRKFSRGALGVLLGYGYKPWKIIFPLFIVWGFGWGFFTDGRNANVIQPTQVQAYADSSEEQGSLILKTYPDFIAPLYSLDAIIPLINLHQFIYWSPVDRTSFGRFILFYFTFHVIMGWGLVSMFIIGLSGILKR